MPSTNKEIVGNITQSKVRGKALGSALSDALTSNKALELPKKEPLKQAGLGAKKK